MKIHREEFRVETSRRVQVMDITHQIEKIVKESGVKKGICHIFLPHATASIILEEAEPGLMKDIERMIEEKFPRGAGYEHDRIDDNANSHLASGFIGQSRTYPVENGEILRGTWQRPLLVELDGPRTRRVVVTILGE